MEAQWHREHGDEVFWEWGISNPDRVVEEPEGLPFLSLPHADRQFTRWWHFQNNGNFKYRPGTYIMAASGCSHGACSFCVENGKAQEIRPVEDVLSEIRECEQAGFRECFDDSATFPGGRWRDEFLGRVNEFRGRMLLGCNLRLEDYRFDKLFHSGFRMCLFGLESANQKTLNIVNKGIKVEDYKFIVRAAKAGLEPHVAVMFGFPWETDADARKTLALVHWLLRKGYAKTAQASFFTQKGFKGIESHRRYIRGIYGACKYPDFWINKIRGIRNADDLKYLAIQIRKGLFK